MPDGQVLEFAGVTKRFGAVAAVSGFSARVEPGVVTGFLGPNGAGKTTSLRILLGLVRATEGTATIGGVPYAKLKNPLASVGAVLEASSFHPGRTAANHLKVYAHAAGLPKTRVDEVLGTVGLADVGGRKVGGFSLGMRQRLGLAYALLGDPGVLVLDEPANGLDPEGIKWMRGLLRELAREGRTVLVSSHLLAEVQQTVDSLLIIAQGRLVFQGGLEDLVDPSEYATVVDAPDRAALVAALDAADVPYEVLRSGLTVRGVDAASIGVLAADAGIALSALQRKGPALEEVFLDLVSGIRVQATPVVAADAAPPAAEAPAESADAPPVRDESSDDADAAPDEPEPLAPEAEPHIAADEGVLIVDEDTVTHAAFAVAATGVIEVVPDADAAAEPEQGADPASEAEQGAAPEEAPEDDANPWVEPAHEAEPDADANPWAEPVPDEQEAEPEPQEDPEPAEARDPDHVDDAQTDSDRDADEFFAAYDRPARDGELADDGLAIDPGVADEIEHAVDEADPDASGSENPEHDVQDGGDRA